MFVAVFVIELFVLFLGFKRKKERDALPKLYSWFYVDAFMCLSVS